MKYAKLSLTVLGAIAIATMLHAKESKVTLSSASYKEVHEVNKLGEKVVKYVESGKILPGDVVMYKNSINNMDKKPADNLVLNNKIPQNMEYVADSANCEKDCKILYSVDGGKSFETPENLKVKEGNLVRAALPSDYTDIRWKLASSLTANNTTHVSFKARLK